MAPATVSPAPATVSPTPVAPSKTKIPGRQPHGPLRKAKKVYWNQLKTGDCFKGWTDTAVSLTRVDCRSPHEEEVTGKFNLSGGRYANGNCLREDGECAYSRAYRSAPRHVGHLQTRLSTGQQNERPFLRVKTSSGSIFLLELT